jgi:hypothetical protein
MALGLISVATHDEDLASRLAKDHQRELAAGETPLLARHLVPVDGYSYVDALRAEVALASSDIEAAEAEAGVDLLGGFSLHSVISDDPPQNTARNTTGDFEVGFLQLYQLVVPVRYGEDEQIARATVPSDLIDRFDVAGIRVFVFEDPSHPDSRYFYVWTEHGMTGVIDGADREPLERWLAAYLKIPKLGDHEAPDLASRLTAVEGFAYTDVDTSLSPEFVVLADIDHSMHIVSDHEDPVGSIILTHNDDADVLQRLVADLRLEPARQTDLHGQSVQTFADERRYALLWTESDVSGLFLTNPEDLETAQRFLGAF